MLIIRMPIFLFRGTSKGNNVYDNLIYYLYKNNIDNDQLINEYDMDYKYMRRNKNLVKYTYWNEKGYL